MEENNNKEKETQRYSESSGTGVLSSIIFLIAAAVAVYFLSKYLH